MKRFLFAILIYFIVLGTANAQNLDWAWARGAYSGNEKEFAKDVAIDPLSGDVVVVGHFSGDLSSIYDPILFAGHQGGGFVAKYTSDGNLKWSFPLGSDTDGDRDNDRCNAVTIDNNGNVYVVGFFEKTSEFKGRSPESYGLISSGEKDAFIAKYDSDGMYLWAVKGGGAREDIASTVCLNSSQVIVSGTYNGPVVFKGTSTDTVSTYSVINHQNVYIIAYELNGAVQWLSDLEADQMEARDIVSGDGNVYLIGDYKGAMDIYDYQRDRKQEISSSNNWDSYVVSFKTTGVYNWISIIIGDGEQHGYSLAKKNSHLYITGWITSKTKIWSPLPSPQSSPSPMLVNHSGNADGHDLFIAKIKKSDGNAQWAFCESGSQDDEATQITVDGSFLYVAGSFENNLTFSGDTTINNPGNKDVFIAKYDTDSVFYSVNTAGGSDHEIPYGLATENSISYLVGEYKDDLTFGPFELEDEHNLNAFVAKIGCPEIMKNDISKYQTVCASGLAETLIGTFPIGGTAPLSYLWESSSDGISWSQAEGTYNEQNYNPTLLGVDTYFRRKVLSAPSCPNLSISLPVLIQVDKEPTSSSAGPNRTICSNSTDLEGNLITTGAGTWTVISGGASITSPNLNTSAVTGLGVGLNSFKWKSENGVCPASSDIVIINVDENPSVSIAGPDQTICKDSSLLSANMPLVGMGIWNTEEGSGVCANVNDSITEVTNLSIGVNKFVWTISNGTCADSKDTVIINVDQSPSNSVVDEDQTICLKSANINAIEPTVGVGVWTLNSSSGTFEDSSIANTTINGILLGTNEVVWTITNGVCPASSSSMLIVVEEEPTEANAGPDQTICSNNCTISANMPLVGTGIWNTEEGSGVCTDVNDSITEVTNLSIGVNKFVWTISNGTCTVSKDTVIINVDQTPSNSIVEEDQTICLKSANLNANEPTVGTGVWTLNSSSGVFEDSSMASTNINELSVGTNEVVWTITNGVCPASSSSMFIVVDEEPTESNVGDDQIICSSNTLMTANLPSVGEGIWTLSPGSGSGSMTDDTNPTSTLNGLSIGLNRFIWTISNGTCNASRDTITIQVDEIPTISKAGPDQAICAQNTSLLANIPDVGVGNWSIDITNASIVDESQYNSLVNGLNLFENTFVWTISNGVCPVSSDTVIIFVDENPTDAFAGIDQTICEDSVVMAANIPTVGVGNWGLAYGAGMASGFNVPSSKIFGLNLGENKFTWTISNGVCPSSVDTVVIKVDTEPTIALAGDDQIICAFNTSLEANSPSVGLGNWTVDNSSASFEDENLFNSTVSGLDLAENRFVWTISNGVCPASRDTVRIKVDENPTVALAGLDQTICQNSSLFSANTPSVGDGEWELISGVGMLSGYDNPVSAVSGLVTGSAKFTWTISNGVCPSSIDTVMINVDENPSGVNAGLDQTICLPNSELSADIPTVGTGQWELYSGTGTVNDEINNNASVSGLLAGLNYFVWTISNGVCPVKTDTVLIKVDEFPTVSNAGIDQTICSDVSSLLANEPTVGIGNWTVITGLSSVPDLDMFNSNVTALGFGLNALVWTVSNGTCPSSSDTVQIFVDQNPTVSAAGEDQIICANNSVFEANTPVVGTAVWSLVTGNGTFESPDSEMSNVTGLGLSTNLFAWTISNGVCPISSDTVRIAVDEEPTQADAGVDKLICDDESFLIGNYAQIGDGYWTLYSGAGDVLYEDHSFSTVSNLGVGANGFIWTTFNGVCPSSTDTVYINVDAEPTLAFAGDDHDICVDHFILEGNEAEVGSSVWNVISGAGSILANNQNNAEVSGLSLGLNEMVWTTSNGVCPSSVDTVSIQVDQEPTIALAGEDQVICIDTNLLNANHPSIGIGSWMVLTGSSSVVDNTNENSEVQDLNIGQNRLVWRISNGVCPISKDTITIQVDETPSIALAGEDQTICNDENILEASIPLIGSGSWLLEQGSGVFEDESIAGTTVSGLGIGVNALVWTTSNGVCESKSDTVIINVDDFPTQALVAEDYFICIDNEMLTANSPIVGVGEWSIFSGSGVLSDSFSEQSGVNELSLGENAIVWSISNGVCAISTDTLKLYVDQEPSLAFAGDDEMLCGNHTVLLANEPSVGLGEWTSTSSISFGNPNLATSSVNDLEFGKDTLIWTISNGVCPSTTDTVIYDVYEAPSVSLAGNDQVICDNQAQLEANSPAVGFGVWTSLNENVIVSDINTENSAVSNLILGENGFVWTINNGICPFTSDTIVVKVDEAPSIAFAGEDQELCSAASVLNANNPAVGIGHWSLYDGTGLIADIAQNSTNLSSLGIGLNRFIWTISNGVCPSSTDTILINIDEQPSISDAGLDQDICAQKANLSANSPEIGLGHWHIIKGNGNITSVDIANTEVDKLGFGVNRLVWTISNGVCPSSSDTIQIKAFDFPSPAFAGVDQTICDDQTKLDADAPEVGAGNWSMLSGDFSIEDQMSNSSNISELAIGKTVLLWTVSNGVCPSTKDSIIVQVDENPTFAEAGIDIITEKNVISLSANSPSVGIGEWSVISGITQIDDINNSSAFIENLEVGENIFRWTISNGVCLESTDEVMISAYEFKIPNGFSPNNDSYNDRFVIGGAEYFTTIKIEVFNKWGGLVYKNDKYDDSWEGTNTDGEPLSDDTYYYIIKIHEHTEAYSGFIVIKRK